MTAWRRWARGVWWYLREVSGESAYDHYVAHQRIADPRAPVLDRRAFEHRRGDLAGSRPQQRCC